MFTENQKGYIECLEKLTNLSREKDTFDAVIKDEKRRPTEEEKEKIKKFREELKILGKEETRLAKVCLRKS